MYAAIVIPILCPDHLGPRIVRSALTMLSDDFGCQDRHARHTSTNVQLGLVGYLIMHHVGADNIRGTRSTTLFFNRRRNNRPLPHPPVPLTAVDRPTKTLVVSTESRH